MHVLSMDRTVSELHQYFTLIHTGLDKCVSTRQFAEPVAKVLDQLTKNKNAQLDLEDRNLNMRARIMTCIFYLRKAIIALGKEIRKSELSLKTTKFYDDFLPSPPPPTQVPIHQQLQAFIEIADFALKNFGKIPNDPRCEMVREQKAPLEATLKKSREVMKEYTDFFRKLENLRTSYKTIQQEAHGVIRSLQKDLLVHFEYNTSDVAQYFLTLSI